MKKWILTLAIALLLFILTFPKIPAIQMGTTNELQITPQRQRKDTYLLCLGLRIGSYAKGCPLEGPCAWDSPHSGGCEHDNYYCVRACIRMMAEFFGGNLPQDRISIYIFEEREGPIKDGQPENDLGHHGTVPSSVVTETLSWALNGVTTYIEEKPEFTDIVQWIDEGRPVMIRIKWDHTGHAEVIVGYDTIGERVYVIDPITAIKSTVSYDSLNIDGVWVPPSDAEGRIAEPTIFTDTDGDGVYDFDELVRFHTDINNPDSDYDGIEDKIEIRSYTFLSNDTFDTYDMIKPDVDRDGLRAELDWDTDNGGCPDGLEDLNHNGKVDIGETDPFDPEDDPIVEYPVANFTWIPQMAWIDETVIFNASQSYSPNGNIKWYAWNFEDENLAATQEPFINHTYSSEGRYNVTVEVTDEKFLKASTSNIVEVTYRTDLDKDGTVNIQDLFTVAKAFGSHGPDVPNMGDPASEKWNEMADVNKDGLVNIQDLFKVAKDFGKTV